MVALAIHDLNNSEQLEAGSGTSEPT